MAEGRLQQQVELDQYWMLGMDWHYLSQIRPVTWDKPRQMELTLINKQTNNKRKNEQAKNNRNLSCMQTKKQTNKKMNKQQTKKEENNKGIFRDFWVNQAPFLYSL